MSRLAFAHLTDATHRLPLPGTSPGQFFPAAGMQIALDEPFYAAALADGSLTIKPAASLAQPTPAPISPAK